MKAVAIDHVVLRVQNLERAKRFYEQILGCPVEKEQPNLGIVHLRLGESLIDLISNDGELGKLGGAAAGRQGPNIDHLCLRLADFDVDRLQAELEEAGIPIGAISIRFGANGERCSIYAEDPDRNGLEFRG